MVVILRSDEYDRWLTCRVEEAPTFFQQYTGGLHAYAEPAPPRAKKIVPPKGQPDPRDAPLI